MAVQIGIAAVAGIITACNVYTDQEIAAQQRFEAVAIGTRESDLISSLGTPQGLVKRSGPSQLVLQFDELSDKGEIRLDETDRANWPQELQFLPERPVTNKVLIYLDSTVWAFYFFSSDNEVEHASVVVS
jgi:hypothetical protein